MKADLTLDSKKVTIKITFTRVKNVGDIGVLCALNDSIHESYKIAPQYVIEPDGGRYKVQFIFTALSNKVIRRLEKTTTKNIHTVEDLFRNIKVCTGHYLSFGQHWGEMKDWSKHALYRKFTNTNK